MQLEDYQNQVGQRYLSLTDAQKESLRKFKETKNGQILMQVLGPEFAPLLNQLAEPKSKGLASRIKP